MEEAEQRLAQPPWEDVPGRRRGQRTRGRGEGGGGGGGGGLAVIDAAADWSVRHAYTGTETKATSRGAGGG